MYAAVIATLIASLVAEAGAQNQCFSLADTTTCTDWKGLQGFGSNTTQLDQDYTTTAQATLAEFNSNCGTSLTVNDFLSAKGSQAFYCQMVLTGHGDNQLGAAFSNCNPGKAVLMCKSDCETILDGVKDLFQNKCNNATYLQERGPTIDKNTVCAAFNDNEGCIKVAALKSGAENVAISFAIVAASILALVY